MQRAATTYSLPRSWRTSERTTFAMLVQLVTPMTSDRLSTFGLPRIACKNTTTSRFGTLIRISVRRIIRSSSHAGAQPLAAPNTTAMTVEIAVAIRPMNSEMRPPYQIIEKISRPMVSVPNRNSCPGAAMQCCRSM